jgi:hypothetical protein
MIWGCISARGVNNIHFIDGIMDKYMSYVYMFQQENNSKHNAELNRQWLIWNIPKQLKTPAQSPDFKPI